MTARTAAVLLAAGSGSRVGADRNKVLLDLVGVPVLVWSVRTVLAVEGVHRVVLVVRPEDAEEVRDAVSPHLGAHDLWVVEGGRERHDSEWRALEVLAADIEAGELDVVAIHDAARPLASPALWRAVVDAAVEHGGALPVTRLPALLGRDGRPAPEVVAVQTPQAFRAADLLDAHRRAQAEGFVGTDTAACLERYTDLVVVGVGSDTANLKVTWPEDVALAAELVSRRSR
ncbi:IspD/TarI family cytidylyltransferase [Nocardioides aurantiacus]|uniref:IspD/TarI family cytidylyltransferase n=1 Tax=Nocardioides aurantiacus TaxID=86796 RepID=UPI00403F9AB2